MRHERLGDLDRSGIPNRRVEVAGKVALGGTFEHRKRDGASLRPKDIEFGPDALRG